MTDWLSAWLLPPLNSLVLLLAGLLALRLRRRWAVALLLASAALCYATAAPFLARAATRCLEVPPPHPLLTAGAGAIVVLGGGSYVAAPEYGTDTPGPAGLERARYAARLSRTAGLPILVSGGPTSGARLSEAEQLRDLLQEDLRTPVRWVEPAAMNTWESARLSEPLLRAEGIRTVILVTHAWHMRRALLAFRAAGLRPIPAPVGYATREQRDSTLGVLPSARGMLMSYIAWREALGLAWYGLRAWLDASTREAG